MTALMALLLLGAGPASAQSAGSQLCRMAGQSSDCIDYGRDRGYRSEPTRPPIDPEERAEARQRRWEQLQESIRNMEHPRAEPPTPVDVPTLVREDVEVKLASLHSASGALVLGLAATELVAAIELGVMMEVVIAAAPSILITAAVVAVAYEAGWIFAKNRRPPDDARDPNGPKAPGKPGAAEGFEDPKGGEAWGQAPNGRWGWVARDGKIWVPTGHAKGGPHGGPQWDVQDPRGRGYENVYPGGRRR